jgi:hypothetical protein
MRKIGLSVAVAALALVAIGAWGASTATTTQARFDAVEGTQIDPAQLTMNAKDMPETEFVDYTFVYN